ncbi:MAG: hypothetical protein AAF688_00920 [Bacteroidota bacterium]
MNTIRTTIGAVLLSVVLTACLGDRKMVNVSEMDDTSFVNKSFKGNLIDYNKDMSACDKLSETDIASLYNVSEDAIVKQDVSKSDQRVPNSPPSCQFFIKDGDNDFLWLRGSMNVQREIGKDEMMGEIAEATGSGEDWEEAWAMQKSMSKSAEWIDGLGMAALWIEAKTELRIKFEGYTLYVFPIKNKLNEAEVARKRDYKSMAIGMARNAGFIK